MNIDKLKKPLCFLVREGGLCSGSRDFNRSGQLHCSNPHDFNRLEQMLTKLHLDL